VDVAGYLTAFGLATAAGLNAWFPLLAVGLLARYTGLIDLDGQWEQLTHTTVLLGLTGVSILDFVGDKIATVDHVLHAIGTVIAPATGILSALGATESLDVSPEAVTVIGLIAAETAHGSRLALRPFVTAGTAGTGNPVVSLIEDVLSGLLSLLAILAPLIAALLIVVLAWIVWRMLRRMRRWRRRRGAGGGRAPPAPA